MECWSIGEIKRSDGVLECWSVGVMVNEEEQKQGLSEIAGLERCPGILQENVGGLSETSL